MGLYVGKQVVVTPVGFDTKMGELTGTVVYIHPKGKYYVVEFDAGKKGTVCESFPISNEDMLEMIQEGVVQGETEPFLPPPPHITAKELEKKLSEMAKEERAARRKLRATGVRPDDE